MVRPFAQAIQIILCQDDHAAILENWILKPEQVHEQIETSAEQG
jgi:hypothetical protein